MYFKTVFTESIAHYSYAIGDGQELIIIDPQPEIDIYLDISRTTGMKITKILETHRNEDFLVGSRALAELTGSDIYLSHHEDLDYEYGEKIKDGHIFQLKDMSIKAIHTPGHTLGHMSYILYHKKNPYMVFTGDTCFYGDIGRIDFYGEDRLEEMAGKMYDSIFNKLMPLGDHVIMYPAHGPGSVCGENIEDRPFTTLGYERRYNPKLQYNSKETFVKANSKKMFKPEYFAHMEEMNLKGTDPIDCNPNIIVKQISDINLKTEYLIDVRSQHAFNKAHIPNSIYIKKSNISNFINWIIPRESDICIICHINDDLKELYINLRRIGYTGDISFLANGIASWYNNNNEVEILETIMPIEYENKKKDYFILDVRKRSETDVEYGNKGMLIPMESIRKDYKKLPKGKNILVICPSGIRSNIVASFLKSKGVDTTILIGGLDAVK